MGMGHGACTIKQQKEPGLIQIPSIKMGIFILSKQVVFLEIKSIYKFASREEGNFLSFKV